MANYNYGDEPASSNFGNGQSTEKSIKSCYAVVYELDNRKWVVAGEGGWSEVHLCEDSLDNSHRILAWTVKSQQVLMNCNVTAECAYKEKSKNFHSFSDENGNRYGLGFHKSESGLKQATHFLKSVKQVIEQCKSDLNPSPPEAPLHEYEKPQNQSKSKTPQHPTPQYPSSSNPTDNYGQNNKSQSDAYGNNNGYGNDDAYNGNQLQSAQPGGGINNNNGSGMGGMPPPNPYQNSNSISNQYGNDYDNNGYGQNQNQNSYNQQKNNYQQPQPPPMFSQAPDNNNGNGNGYNQGYGAQQNRNNDYQQQNKYGQQNVNDYGSNNNNQYGSSQPQQPVQPSYNNNNQQNTYNNPVSPNNKDPTSPSTAALKNGVGSGGNNNNFPQYHLAKEQHKSIPTVPLGPLGNLKILPPKQQKHLSGDKKIKQPTAVEHKIRVLHDKETGLYSGLPKEWQEQLNKQFGVNPKQLPGISFNQYQSKIPKVLHMLRSALEEANGYQQVGIFRLAPNASDNKAVKEKIDKGQLENSEEKVDVNVYANLIKVWFRDLPDPLLNCVNPDMIEHVATQSDAANVVNSFPEPNKSIFLWLCDMCVDIAKFEKTNKMSAQNMAIVVGPNLFNTDKFENPMKAMTYSGKVVEFFKHAILWRQSSM